MARLSRKFLAFVAGGAISVTGSVALADTPTRVFEDVCLKTANQPDQIFEVMNNMKEWERVAPSDQLILTELDDNRTWYLSGDFKKGIAVSAKMPLGLGDWTGAQICMLKFGSPTLTRAEAKKFLADAGGIYARPAAAAGADDIIYFAFNFSGNWMLAGATLSSPGTMLILTDTPDKLVLEAIEGAANGENSQS